MEKLTALEARFRADIVVAVAERGHDATDKRVFAPLWLDRQARYLAGILSSRRPEGPCTEAEVEDIFAAVAADFRGGLEGNVARFIEWARGLGHYEEVMPWWGLPEVCPFGE